MQRKMIASEKPIQKIMWKIESNENHAMHSRTWIFPINTNECIVRVAWGFTIFGCTWVWKKDEIEKANEEKAERWNWQQNESKPM